MMRVIGYESGERDETVSEMRVGGGDLEEGGEERGKRGCEGVVFGHFAEPVFEVLTVG